MRRFHDPALPPAGTFALAAEEAEHLVRVLRAVPGDEVLVFDGRGREARCRVVAAGRREGATLEIVADSQPLRPRRDVAICPAVPRGDRMEWLVEKCVEAGASAVIPWAAARSVRDRAGGSTLRRWRRAAVEACKQSGRADVPDVSDVVPLADAIGRSAGRVLLVADPAATLGLEAVGGAVGGVVDGGAAAVSIFVGPEGGLDPAESAALVAAGARPFGLGPLILRIETAAVLAVHRAAN